MWHGTGVWHGHFTVLGMGRFQAAVAFLAGRPSHLHHAVHGGGDVFGGAYVIHADLLERPHRIEVREPNAHLRTSTAGKGPRAAKAAAVSWTRWVSARRGCVRSSIYII